MSDNIMQQFYKELQKQVEVPDDEPPMTGPKGQTKLKFRYA